MDPKYARESLAAEFDKDEVTAAAARRLRNNNETPVEAAALNLILSLHKALHAVRLRIMFMEWPAEAMWQPTPGYWVPDWRYECQLVENALFGIPIHTAEKPTDTVPANQVVGQFYVSEYLQRKIVDGVAEVSLNRNALTDWPDWAQEFQRNLFAPGVKLPSETKREVTEGLAAMRPRIVAAIERITSGHGCMRIPAEPNDPDLVLSDILNIIDGREIKPTVAGDVAPVDALQKLVNTTIAHHFYAPTDPDCPKALLDSNGDMVLAMCRVCGQAEGDLEEKCPGPNPDDGYGSDFATAS